MKTSYKLTYIFLNLSARGLARIPIRKLWPWAVRLAAGLYRWVPKRQQQALLNLQQAFPQRSLRWRRQVLRQSYRIFTYNMLVFMVLSRKFEALDIIVRREHLLKRALTRQRGVLWVTGHFGAWEVLSAWLGRSGYPLVPVAFRQKNRGADRFSREQRERTGVRQIYTNTPVQKIITLLRSGNIIGLGSDQDARRRGVFVPFFGRPASTPRGSAVLHLKTGAPLLFATCRWDGRSFIIEVEPVPVGPRDGVREITQAYTRLLERRIRQFPAHYFWWHRRWKSQPRGAARG